MSSWPVAIAWSVCVSSVWVKSSGNSSAAMAAYGPVAVRSVSAWRRNASWSSATSEISAERLRPGRSPGAVDTVAGRASALVS